MLYMLEQPRQYGHVQDLEDSLPSKGRIFVFASTSRPALGPLSLFLFN
jgi:hypothetical protein